MRGIGKVTCYLKEVHLEVTHSGRSHHSEEEEMDWDQNDVQDGTVPTKVNVTLSFTKQMLTGQLLW